MNDLKEPLKELNWDEIYKKYLGQVRSTCTKILGYYHIYLEDAISNTFEIGISKQHQYNPERAAINTWLCQIAKNLCYDIKDKDKRTTSIADRDFAQEVEESDDRKILAKELMRIIGTMPDSYGKIVFMKYFEGKTYKDLSIEYDRNETTIRVIVKRFLDKIRDKTKNTQCFANLQKSKTRIKFPKIRGASNKTQMYRLEKGIFTKNKSFYVILSVGGKSKYVGKTSSLLEARQLKQTVLDERG